MQSKLSATQFDLGASSGCADIAFSRSRFAVSIRSIQRELFDASLPSLPTIAPSHNRTIAQSHARTTHTTIAKIYSGGTHARELDATVTALGGSALLLEVKVPELAARSLDDANLVGPRVVPVEAKPSICRPKNRLANPFHPLDSHSTSTQA